MLKKSFGLFLFIGLASISFAQNPTLWRGEKMNGSYPDKGLMKEWPASGPEMIWHFDEAGKGFSSPVFANNKIYLTGMEETTGYIFVLTEEGSLIKKYAYGQEFTESYPGARTSPTVVGDLLYMYSGLGRLVCMKADSGELVWSKEVFSDFDGEQIVWGVTETLLVDENTVYVTPGGKKNNVLALNRMTGELIWSSKALGEQSAYCSPLLVDLPTRKLLVTHTASHIIGLDAGSGKLLWSHEQPNRYSVHANTPLYHDYGLFCFSGYGHGGVMLKLNEDGSEVTKQWFSKDFDSRMGGAIYYKGHIYGSGDASRKWLCLDWETGEQVYESKDLTVGNVIFADGLIYGYSQRGELAVAPADPSGLNITGETKITMGSEQHWAHLVIHMGILYVRHGNVLMAYKI